MPPANTLTIVGLGPGDPALLTLGAQHALAAASEVWLRTRRHPGVESLPAGPRYESFDAIYDAGPSFEAVYAAIVERVLALAARPQGCVFAVPGHPLFGEAVTAELLRRAPEAGIDVTIVPGVSFLDAVAAAVGLDPLADGCLLLDALDLGRHGRRLSPRRPTVIAQVYDRRAASQAKLALLEAYAPDHPVRIVRAGSPRAGVTTRPLAELDHGDAFDHLTSLYLPPAGAFEDTSTFEGLRAIVAKLRDPDGGCPWDLLQTHASLRRYMLEEAYEALEAIDRGDPARLAEELGDLMMQVLLHAQLAEDAEEFTIEDVMAAIATKLVRRHPHVFGTTEVEGADEVLRNWETLKREERGDAPLLDAVPAGMPALMQAQSVQSRAERNAVSPPIAPLDRDALAGLLAPAGEIASEALGDLLFRIVAAARASEIDAEDALRGAIARYRADVARLEVEPGA